MTKAETAAHLQEPRGTETLAWTKLGAIAAIREIQNNSPDRKLKLGVNSNAKKARPQAEASGRGTQLVEKDTRGDLLRRSRADAEAKAKPEFGRACRRPQSE